jgi:hypothetical protein
MSNAESAMDNVRKAVIILMKGGDMGYTNADLKSKIAEMYPEVQKHGISVSLDFNNKKNAYIVKFQKDKHELTTHLEKKDADECMNGVKCVYLGVQLGQFVTNFEIIEKE